MTQNNTTIKKILIFIFLMAFVAFGAVKLKNRLITENSQQNQKVIAQNSEPTLQEPAVENIEPASPEPVVEKPEPPSSNTSSEIRQPEVESHDTSLKRIKTVEKKMSDVDKINKFVTKTNPVEENEHLEAEAVATNEPQSERALAENIQKNSTESIKLAEQIRGQQSFWLWLGLGENFQLHQQTVPSVSGQLKFQNIQGPSISLAAGMLGQQLGAELSYKEIPGRMDSSATVTVINGNFSWKILGLDSLYKIENSNTTIRSGLQFDSIPFMDLDATNSTLTIRSNTVTTLKIGFEKSYLFSEKLNGEWIMQYHHPVLSGTSNGNIFNVKPEFAFSGSLGTMYSYNPNAYIGLFWYGQWYQYQFEYGTSLSSYSGKQTLFYSDIDIRVGWRF